MTEGTTRTYLRGGIDERGGRVCHDCHTWKPISEYRLDSHGNVRNQCKPCQLAYATERKRIARRAAVGPHYYVTATGRQIPTDELGHPIRKTRGGTQSQPQPTK
jgi:hypothetical protein